MYTREKAQELHNLCPRSWNQSQLVESRSKIESFCLAIQLTLGLITYLPKEATTTWPPERAVVLD